MVSKPRYKEMNSEPPPLEESWWEALLSEEEAYQPAPALKPAARPKAEIQVGEETIASEHEAMNWEKAQCLYTDDQAIRLQVTGFNRGGLLVTGDEMQGFVPISHLVKVPAPKEESEQEQWLESYLGEWLDLKVIECDPARGRIVFSERAALAEAGSRNRLLDHLKPAECIHGTVTNVTDFGVFVDLGGVEGLIHVSELSWGRVRHPCDMVALGQPVEVYVINVDRERARVALSLKRLFANPWETAEQRYFPGQITEAVVTSIVPFGAFARLEEGLDGLIHISEVQLSSPGVHLNDLLREGQQVHVRVLHVDSNKQRLGLSLRLEE